MPKSPYAASKQVTEILSKLYTQTFGLEVVALRYFNVYGPGQSPDSAYAAAIPIFLRKMITRQPVVIFGDGGQTRDFVFVGDVVRANLMAADHPAAAGQVINICSGAETSLLDLLRVMNRLFPNSPPYMLTEPRSGDIYKSLGNPALAEQLIGFKAKTKLESGLERTADWYKKVLARHG
jgi:UDP-glucose 4-epimerase